MLKLYKYAENGRLGGSVSGISLVILGAIWGIFGLFRIEKGNNL